MDVAGLERWVREAHGARLMGAVGEELSLETPLPIRRVTRLWLQLERGGPDIDRVTTPDSIEAVKCRALQSN